MEQFEKDLSAQDELGMFLDRTLYPYLRADLPISFERVNAKEWQTAGVDVILHEGERQTYFDEKAQLHYINKPRDSFAFEIDYFYGAEWKLGWFVNDELKTRYYVLVWILESANSDPATVRECDFQKVECLFLRKDKLRAWVEGFGLTREMMLDTAREMRRSNETLRQTGVDGVRFYRSKAAKYREMPTNLVIQKKYLDDLAERHYLVTRGPCVGGEEQGAVPV